MIGTRLADRYELLSELGRGGMAVVYRARDPRLDREVAIKLIASERLSVAAAERFQREAELIAGLDHPSIVPVYDFGSHGRWLFLVMPVLHGANLHQLMRRQRLVLDTTLEIIARAAEALAYSASQGVVHRDVKPENLMVSLDEDDRLSRLWVMDFGLAVADMSSRLTRTGNLPGTLAYLSPEQIITGEVDGRSDLYSLGVILYECLAGRPPFSGSPASVLYRIVNEEAPPLLPHGVEEGLEALVLTCLRKSPSERFSSGDELALALREHLRHLRPEAVHRLPGPATVDEGEELPLVGRDAELASLGRALDAAFAGSCQLMLVGGERGLGISRLSREAETLARRRGFQVLRGRFSDHSGGPSYEAFGELIFDFYTQRRSSTSITASSPGPVDLSDLAGELLEVFPVLREIPELAAEAAQGPETPQGPDPPPAVETPGEAETGRPAEDPRRLFELIARTLSRLAGSRPQALVIEQLQIADASIQLILYLVRRLGSTRTFILGTYRPSGTSRGHPLQRLIRGLAGDPRCHHVHLQALDAERHRELLEHLLGGGEIDHKVCERLYEVTEGNPLFAQEVVRALWDAGDLELDADGHWRLVHEDALARELPDTVQQAVVARLERLGDEALEVLGVASVLGRRFRFRDLEELWPNEGEDIEDAVDFLVRRGLLSEVPRTRGDQLAFESPLVREVVYSRLPRRRRRRLHRRCAQRFEQRAGENPDRLLTTLLHHFVEGDVPERAVHYGRLQARRSLDSHCWDDAEAAVRLALEFTDEVVHAEGDLRLMLSEALAGRGQGEAALREAAKAVDAYQSRGDTGSAARATRTLVEVAWKNRRMDDVARWLETGLELARGSDDPEVAETLVDLLHLAATAANLRGEQARARRFLDEARGLDQEPTSAHQEVLETDRALRVGMVGQVTTLDPAVATSVQEAEVLSNVFEPLVEIGADGRAVPRLARSVSSGEDLSSYVVQLRRDRAFSDGTPLDAEAVKRSIEEAGRLGAQRLRPMIAGLVGGEDFLAGRLDEIPGLEVTGPLELRLELVRPMPLLPALLSALGMSVAARRDGEVLGTGPYALARHETGRWVLARNPHHPAGAAGPESLEFIAETSSQSIAAGLVEGRLDLGRDLAAAEIEDFLARPTYHRSVYETPLPNIAFLMLNRGGPSTHDPRLRRVLTGVLEVREVVWRSLGRFALPAGCWIPPGVLGHDPDAPQPRRLDRFEGLGQLQDLETQPRILKALVHPIFRQRFRPILEAIASEWALLGLELQVEELPLADLGQLRAAAADTDVLISRWYPDYPDPDAYTHAAFARGSGMYGDFVGSPEIDELLEQARQSVGANARERLYWRAQRLLVHQDVVVPLFHEVEFRVTTPALGGVKLLSGPPYVDYRRLGWHRCDAAPAAPRRLGHLRLPLVHDVSTLDPARVVHGYAIEVMSAVFEGLTRIDRRGSVVPHLAASIDSRDGGRCHRVQLRDVRFHDGRRLRAQDVRFTFQRLLRQGVQDLDRPLATIEGAAAFQDGQVDELGGFVILSENSFELRLSRRIDHFLVFLSDPTLSILPEGSGSFEGTWRDGCVGTGPFKVVGFEPGQRVELAAHREYWRDSRPSCQGLLFEKPPADCDLEEELRAGRFHLVSELDAGALERVAADSRFAGGIVEHPAFATFFLVFNRVQGPLTDLELRRRFCRHAAAALEKTAPRIGRLGVVARGLIPPGLLAHRTDQPPWIRGDLEPLDDLRLETAIHPLIAGQYADFWNAFSDEMASRGIILDVRSSDLGSMEDAVERRAVDIVASRWAADAPDPSSFASVVYSDDGHFGRMVCHERIDRLVERGVAETSPRARQAAYEELERQLAGEALLWPLFHQQICCVAHPDVEGLRLGYGWPTVAYDELSLRR